MSKTTTNNWDNKELGVLWKRSKNGTNEKYLTGTINLKSLGFDKDVPIIIFTNKNKNKDTHPDLRIYVSEKKKAATAAPAATTAAPAPAADESLI